MTRVLTKAVDVMCVVADGGPAGGPAAFEALESVLPGLRGRRFYATYLSGEYRACIALEPGESAAALGLEAWRIPGGAYERMRLVDWEHRVGDIGTILDGMVPASESDDSRPSIEFYKSARELILFRPVR